MCHVFGSKPLSSKSEYSSQAKIPHNDPERNRQLSNYLGNSTSRMNIMKVVSACPKLGF